MRSHLSSPRWKQWAQPRRLVPLLTILAAGIALTLSLLDVVRLSQAEQIITALLALLAIDALTERLALLEQLEKRLNDISTLQLEQRKHVGMFLHDRRGYASLQGTIGPARHICFLGPSLVNIFSQWGGYILYEKLNKEKSVIQALLLDPSYSSMVDTAETYMGVSGDLHKDIQLTLSSITNMIQEGVQGGSIEVRVMAVNPSYSMVLVDPEAPHGRIFVEFIGYHTKLYERPHIELTRQDGHWYDYFYKQYRQLWEDSKVELKS